MLCPVVVGRDDELGLLRAELDRGRGGSGSLVFLLGEAGIGKSRLTREAVVQASDLDMAALRGRAVQSVAPVPFRPLAEALQSALRDRRLDDPGLAAYRAALGQLVPDWAGVPTSQEASPLALLEAVVWLLRALANPQGLLLTLEDLDWADADTLSVVEYLADNLSSEAVLVLATVRSDEASPALTLAESLAARRAATLIRLERLPGPQVAEMVAACIGGDHISPEVLEALRRRAEGVPFLVEELLSAALTEEGGAPRERVEQAVPASYRELVRSRLARVPAQARRVVSTAAVLGRTFDWSLIPEIAALPEEEVLEGLRSAVEAQLVSASTDGDAASFEFRHTLLRDAILHELLPPERRDLSLQAADVIEDSRPGLPGELCELAAELRERGGDREGAFRLLIEAAWRALARTALGTAELTAERARRLGHYDPWLEMGADLLLAEILSMAGKADRLQEVGARALEAVGSHLSTGTPDRLAAIHLRIARGLVEAGSPGDAEPHVVRAAELAREETLAGRVQAVGARVALARGDLEAASASAAEALASAERLGLPEAACDALLVRGRLALHRGDPAGLDGLERELEPPEPIDVDPFTLSDADREAAGAYRYPETLDEAIKHLESDEVLLGALGDALARSFLAVRRSEWEAYSAMPEEERFRAHFLKY